MRKALSTLCFVTSLALFAGLAGAALSAPDREAFALARSLDALVKQLQTDPWAKVDLPQLARPEAPEEQTAAAAPVAPVTGTPRFQMLDMRLPLAMISQSHGQGDNQAVLRAQGEGVPQALVLREGHANAPDLTRAALEAGAGRIGEDGALVLSRPLVVWDTAELTLMPGETVRLDRSEGAFVLVLGALRTTGARIEGTEEENAHDANFRPFVVAGSGGQLKLETSTFAGLGFGHTEKFAGVAIARNGLMLGRGTSHLIGNLFDGIGSVWIDTAQDVQIRDNRFRSARKAALVVTNAGRPVIAGNLFFGGGEFNAVQVLRGSFGARIEDNVILGGTRAGIVVKFDSHRAQIRSNVVWKRDGTGIIFAKSNCGVIADNWVIQNRQKGIEVRTARGAIVEGNRVALNRNTGIWVSAQRSDVVTRLAGNVLSQNRAGLTTATAAQLVLAGNDFSGQVPRFLSGDVAPQNAAFAQSAGADALVLTAAGVARDAVPEAGCAEGASR